jgi:hypothetical protein
MLIAGKVVKPIQLWKMILSGSKEQENIQLRA